MRREPLPPTLDEEVVHYLEDAGEILEFSAGDPIIRRGDAGSAFFVVLSGHAEVRLVGEDGQAIPLRQIGAGAFFGEMSILTGEPVSADVIATEPATLLSYPRDRFSTAMGECEPLRDQVMASMASNLRGSSTDVWNLKQRAEALSELLDSGTRSGPVVAQSAKMRAVVGEIDRLATDQSPTLIHGDAGTGKLFIAHKLHERNHSQETPFIVVDCRDLSDGDAREVLVGTSHFGGLEEEPSSADSLHRYGAIHLANRGSLVLRHIEALSKPAQTALADYLDRYLSGSINYPETRIVATTCIRLEALLEPTHFDSRLATHLSGSVIAMPTLRERRHDILPLASQFLEERQPAESPPISKAAEHVLVSRRYQHGNVAELREAIDLAALFAGDGEILAEHIFTGPKEHGSPLEFDLGQVPLVRWLISDRVIEAARWAVFGVFSAIIAACLFAGETAMGRISNALIWGVWWPVLIVSFLFIGRLWCSVCPLSTAALMARKFLRLERPPGSWLKKRSAWLIAAGFVLVVWVEQVFHLTAVPTGAGALLLSLAGAAAIFGIVYQRETWCRYVCPIGNLGAVYALPATVSLRANPSVCATCCTTHECHKGSETHAGCPVFHHPLYARNAHMCKLCFNCMKSCPHGSPTLYLHPPLLRLWRQADLGGALGLFALVIFFISPLMLAVQTFERLADPGIFTLATIASVGLAFAVKTFLPQRLFLDTDPDPTASSRVAFALLILAWGPATAYHLSNSPLVTSLTLRSAQGSLWETLLPGGEAALLPLLQLAVVSLAAALTTTTLWGLRRSLDAGNLRTSRAGWRVLFALCALYTVGVVALVALQSGVSWP